MTRTVHVHIHDSRRKVKDAGIWTKYESRSQGGDKYGVFKFGSPMAIKSGLTKEEAQKEAEKLTASSRDAASVKAPVAKVSHQNTSEQARRIAE